MLLLTRLAEGYYMFDVLLCFIRIYSPNLPFHRAGLGVRRAGGSRQLVCESNLRPVL